MFDRVEKRKKDKIEGKRKINKKKDRKSEINK